MIARMAWLLPAGLLLVGGLLICVTGYPALGALLWGVACCMGVVGALV